MTRDHLLGSSRCAGPIGSSTPAISRSCWSHSSRAAVNKGAQLQVEPLAPLESAKPNSSPLPCLALQLGRTRASSTGDGGKAVLTSPPFNVLRGWLQCAEINRDPSFVPSTLGASSMSEC
jgi:hypothetical protein